MKYICDNCKNKSAVIYYQRESKKMLCLKCFSNTEKMTK